MCLAKVNAAISKAFKDKLLLNFFTEQARARFLKK